MIVLSTTSDILRLATSTSASLDVHASFVDNTLNTFSPSRQNTTVITATTTTVVSSPATTTQRGVKHLSAHARGGANTVIVEHFDGSNAYRLANVSLLSGETLEYEDGEGWRVRTADGSFKGIGATGSTGATGPIGPTGDRGEPGDQGDQGDMGPPGATGPQNVGTIVSQIGWNPASLGTSSTLTMLAAPHQPGLYEICPVTIIRTTATGVALSASCSWSSPTFGAESKNPFGLSSWATSGTLQTSLATSAQPPRAFIINSDGSAAITIVWSAGLITLGSPVADLYACVRLVGI